MILHLSYLLMCAALLTAGTNIRAQQKNASWNADASVGALSSAPSSFFRSVPGIASPGDLRYDPVSGGSRLQGALGADLPVLGELRLGVRVDMHQTVLRYEALERAPIATEGGSVVTATLRHNLQTSMTLLGAMPYVRYEPTTWLSVGAGLPLYGVAESRYTQTMVFGDPAGIRFVDGSLEQITAKGDVPNRRSIIPMVTMFAEGTLPVSSSGTWVLVPRIGLTQALAAVTKDGAFTMRSFSASIGLRYRVTMRSDEPNAPEPPKQIPTELPKQNAPLPLAIRVERDTFVELTRGINETMTMLMNTAVDTIVEQRDGGEEQKVVRRKETYRMAVPKPPSVLRAALQLRFVDDEGEVTQDARLSAVRVESRRVVSFVPAVVFDNSSSQIPTRYQPLTSQQARSWKEASISGVSSGHWQYQVLNVIGSRMKRLPSTTCTLVGADDAGSKEIALARIDAVREYLVTRFGISQSRIQNVLGSENRGTLPAGSVSLEQSSPELLAPIEFTVSTIETQLPRVQLVPDVISEAGVRTWTIEAKLRDVLVRTFKGSGSLPSSIPWDMNDDIEAEEAFKVPIVLTLHVNDIDEAQTDSDPLRISLTSRLPLASASRPVKRTEVLTFGHDGGTRQSSPIRQGADGVRPLAEWTMRGLDPPERALYDARGVRLSVQVLERR
ncbi:MAG: hypothetical protein FGM32_03940 [Candidatus Kapabacteria bacterium]|nr:hypothetical protein [Candidatus Kapabacteria bacterium]